MTTATPPAACTECAAARLYVHHGFRADCRGCTARTAARAPEHDDARRNGRLDPRYIAMLARVGVTHAEAKAAWQADALNLQRPLRCR